MTALMPLALVALAACSNESFVEPAAAPKLPEISVGLASTRLGADCLGRGGQRVPMPAPPPATGKPARARNADPDAPPPPSQRIPCEQTAVHLSIRSPATAAATTIKLKRVELLDRDGTLLEQLTGNTPSRWGTERFEPWDERTIPGQTMAVGYKLNTPDWSKIPNANNRSFKMRVIVTVGDTDRTLEATAELRVEDENQVIT